MQETIITQHRDLEVIQNGALGPFADYEQSLVADEDVAWQCKYDQILNLPAAGSFANRKRTSSHSAAN